MAQISIDNGTNFITPEEAVEGMEWDIIASYMDDDTREAAHANVAPCTEVEFLTEYLRLANKDLIIG